MSDTVLELWDPVHGLPRTITEAGRLSLQLLEVKAEPSQKILAFAQYVQELSQQQTEDFSDYVNMVEWVANEDTALIRIELPRDDWERPLVMLAEAAMKHKLVGFVEDLTIGFLPTGKILPEKQQPLWKGLKSFLTANAQKGLPRNPKQYRKLVAPLYELMLARHGFTKKKASYDIDYEFDVYIRNVTLGEQYIEMHYAGGGGILPCNKR